jgi:hypothetical protein
MSKVVFDANPNVNELLSFEDGTCFLNDNQGQQNAFNYAKQNSKEYKLITREEVIAPEVTEELTPKNKNKNK